MDKYQKVDLLIKYAQLNLKVAVALKNGLASYAGAEEEYKETMINCMVEIEKELGIE